MTRRLERWTSSSQHGTWTGLQAHYMEEGPLDD